jgi:hypothetical protein
VLGVGAAAGRTLTDADDAPADAAAAVISDAFWWRRFARDPAAVGRTLLIDGAAFTVVGVTPRGFSARRWGSAPDFWSRSPRSPP